MQSKLNVLIVDDGQDFLLLWRLLLEGDPRVARVREAASGREAIDQLRSGEPVDVVLTDDRMANGSGFDVARFVQTAMPWVPVVLTSCASDDAREGVPHGATMFVDKERTVRSDLGQLLLAAIELHAGAGVPAAA